ncbi:Protein tweety [Halotydeus destructor]|nr:Protein tweety [Halotydeus destructor]
MKTTLESILVRIDMAGFNFTRWSPTGDYNMSLVADYLHKIPHLDIKLQRINGTFDPHDNEYLESLGILVAIPGFWLIVTLLFFLIFFLCRCCDVNNKKTKSLGCCKCFLFLFASISVMVIAIGLAGNYQTHVGMTKVSNYTRHLSDMVDTLRNETNIVEDTLETKVDEDLNKISRKLIGPLVRNYTVLNVLQEQLLHMRRNVTKGINRIGEMNQKIERLDLSFIPRNLDLMEQIRWPATFGILGFLLFFCMLLFCGICRHSRCLLILFSVLGLLSLVICFVLTSLYLGIAVSGSDFCFDPKPFLHRQFNNVVESSVVSYYLNCEGLYQMNAYAGPNQNPFRRQLREIRKAVDGFEDGLIRTMTLCDTYCPDLDVRNTLTSLKEEAKKTQDTINLLTKVSECHEVYKDYLFTMSGACKETLEGVTLLLISTAATGICFTLLVLCASHTWINIRKKRPDNEHTGEEADPFLPPASATSTATSTSSSKRVRDSFVSGSGTGGRPRFAHTPPQTPHYPAQSPLVGGGNQLHGHRTPGGVPPHHPAHTAAAGGTGHEQMTFLSQQPPPSYEQVGSGHLAAQQQAHNQQHLIHGHQHHGQYVPSHHQQQAGQHQTLNYHQYGQDGTRYVSPQYQTSRK